MGLKEFLTNMIKTREDKSTPEDDYITKDKYLRSLRREYRLIQEEKEKARLKQAIRKYKALKIKQNLYGIGQNNIFNQKRYINQRKGKPPGFCDNTIL